MEIPNKNTLINDIKGGINLLLGAGFSKGAKSANGQYLLDGEGLKNLICEELDLGPDYKPLPLDRLCTVLQKDNLESQVSDMLAKCFRVNDYDSYYNTLKDFNIRNIITTNIDDLIHKIFTDSESKYINDIIEHGPNDNDENAINYVPIHGSVNYPNRGYIFTSLQIAGAYQQDISGHEFIRQKLASRPTLIIGYNLADPGVLSMFENKHQVMPDNHNKWILSHNTNRTDLLYLKSLGLKVITGSTEEFLTELSQLTTSDKTRGRPYTKYSGIPVTQSLTPKNLQAYFCGGAPNWYDVIYNRIAKVSIFDTIFENALANKNTIILGVNYSGKTTLLMQIANELRTKTEYSVQFFDYLTEDQAALMSRDNAQRKYILVDNFCGSVTSINRLANTNNFTLIVADRGFEYDTTSSVIKLNLFECPIDISELKPKDFTTLFGSIPDTMRNRKMFSPKLNNNVQPFALEFIGHNILKKFNTQWEQSLLGDLETFDSELRDILVASCFIHNCKGGVTDEVLCSFIGNYSQQSFDKIDQLRNYLSEHDKFGLSNNNISNDNRQYYLPRSNLFSDKIVKGVKNDIFSAIYKQLYHNVRTELIPRGDLFRRNAYKVYYTRRVFEDWEEGKQFYDTLYHRSGNYYDLQHAALYLNNQNKFKDAFAYVEEALDQSKHRVASIRNTHAQILFKANIRNVKKDDIAYEQVQKSMSILDRCFNSEDRTRNHAIRYAEQALELSRQLKDDNSYSHLIKAKEIIEQELSKGHTHKISRLLRQISDITRRY